GRGGGGVAGTARAQAALLPADLSQSHGADDERRDRRAAPGHRRATSSPGRRGRVRRKPLLRNAPARSAEGPRSRWRRRLHRHVLEDPVPRTTPRLAGGAAPPDGPAPPPPPAPAHVLERPPHGGAPLAFRPVTAAH